jgi:hypothetical protein
MHKKFKYLAAAIAMAGPVAAHAQTAAVGFDGLIGVAADDSTATGPDDSTTLAGLPSLRFGEDVLVQIDGLLADHRDDTFVGGALRIGAQIADGAYIGAYGSFTDTERQGGYESSVSYNYEIWRLGGELRFDLGDVVIASVAGYEDPSSGTIPSDETPTEEIYDVYDGKGRFFAFSELWFEPLQGIQLSLGHRYTGGNHAAAAGVVIGLGPNIALVADGRLGEGDYQVGLFGLRIRFGGKGDKSPLLANRMIEDLFILGNTRRTLVVPLPPDDDGCGPGGGYCDL